MQLFKGEEKKTGVNWISTNQNFGWPFSITEVRVLDMRDEPIKGRITPKGDIGIFAMSKESKLSRTQFKTILKEKYGYYKVRIRREWKSNFWHKLKGGSLARFDGIGDTTWVRKEVADKYKLEVTQTRIMQGSSWGGLFGGSVLNVGFRRAKLKKGSNVDTLQNGNLDTCDSRSEAFERGLDKLQEKYSVDVSTLGWINCDRFYNDRREKINYYVNLQDSAINYYTMIVFNKFRSMMAGYITGNNVQFSNVPIGETVKIISIGIDKNGDAVMAMKETKISKETFTGLQFESTSASTIKSTLRREDN